MLDTWVKEVIVKEGCSGCYFPLPPQPSPMVPGQGTAIAWVFFLQMRTTLGHGFNFYQYSIFRCLPKKGKPSLQEPFWISVGYLYIFLLSRVTQAIRTGSFSKQLDISRVVFWFLSPPTVGENLSCSSPDFLMFSEARETLMEIQTLPLSSFEILRQLVNFYLSFPIYKMSIIITFDSVFECWTPVVNTEVYGSCYY